MNKFVIDSLEYTSAENGQYVFRDESTIGYCFINNGNCPIAINNFILLPNSVLKTFEIGYLDLTRWQINFQTFDACSITNSKLVVLIYSAR
jgi:hypothetical protein